jgi:hypothetical protein
MFEFLNQFFLYLLMRVSQNLHRYHCASLCIRQSVMMVLQIKSAMRCNGLQLMVGQVVAKRFPRSAACTMKLIIGIIHLIHAMRRPQTTLIERAIVRHQRQALDFWRNFFPYMRENFFVFGIGGGQSVNIGETLPVPFRLGAYKTIKLVGNLDVANNNDANTANA